jgi:hypothetical protein
VKFRGLQLGFRAIHAAQAVVEGVGHEIKSMAPPKATRNPALGA